MIIRQLSIISLLATVTLGAWAQDYNEIDEYGNVTPRNEANRNFNPHNKDTTKKSKVVPKGIYVWTVDRRFGDMHKAEVDTLPYLFPQSTLGAGMTGQYNTLGNNYSARQTRIVMDRKLSTQSLFTDTYSQVLKAPDEWHFTNTLSPITNLTYDNCGDKLNGEDHLGARFAVNAGKHTGLGFDIDYAYARGYFQNQSTSHLGATFSLSHLADQYQLHLLLSTNHQKASENGGISKDDYVTHPELFTESFSSNEIPTILERNWNRNHHHHLFLTHHYSLGFYRKVKMTSEEIKARQFAAKTKQKNEREDSRQFLPQPTGRPDHAAIAGNEPLPTKEPLTADTTRIRVDSKEMADSLLALQAQKDSLEKLMKREFVPVTSLIHTAEVNAHERVYMANATPEGYYANTFYNTYYGGTPGDSIYDKTKYLDVKNTLALALMEGFNKYAPAGIKAFASHEVRRFDMPLTSGNNNALLERYTEHNISLGGQLQKQLGHTLHYDLVAETWVAGEDAGQLKFDAQADVNFRLLGDTVRLQVKGYFYRLAPTFYQRNYHSKHLWWENTLDKETRTRIEGAFSYGKTNTMLRVAVEEIQNYTYLGMSYTREDGIVKGLDAGFRQHTGNVHLMMAQLDQKFKVGPLHWDNVVTYQMTSNKHVLPLPTLNIFSNLYVKFMVARVLRVELGGSATWFTKYEAPDFLPQLNSFAIQENTASRVELGEFPFVDVYANMHLKHARFFVMMQNVAGNALSKKAFLVPHYPMNTQVIHFGISWNFFN